jgi:hypothetical protein
MNPTQALHIIRNVIDQSLQAGVIKSMQDAQVIAQALNVLQSETVKPSSVMVTADQDTKPA